MELCLVPQRIVKTGRVASLEKKKPTADFLARQLLPAASGVVEKL
jgi:hypothetical protein